MPPFCSVRTTCRKIGLTRVMDKIFGPFFRVFNRVFIRSSGLYGGGVKRIVGFKVIAIGVYALLLASTYFVFKAVPPGFVPVQDKQYLVSFAQLPDGATLERTEKVIREMSDIALKEPGVESAVAFPGLSINGFINSSSAGIVFVTLKPFEERKTPDLSGMAIAHKLQMKYGGVKDAFIAIFPRLRRCRVSAPLADLNCRSRTGPILVTKRSIRR